jgi:hypothetical protein
MKRTGSVDEDDSFIRILRPRGILRLIITWSSQREQRLRQRQRTTAIENVTAIVADTHVGGTVVSREQDGAEWIVAFGATREVREHGRHRGH